MESTNVPYHFIYRIIFVGDASVGKTAIANALISDRVPVLYSPTIGIDFFSTINVLNDETIIKSQIWDTAGQEYYLSIVESYFRNIISAFLIYDVSKRITFENITQWINRITDINDSKIFFVLIGNKTDLKREVSEEEGKQYAEKNGLLFFETTKKNRKEIRLMFYDVIEHIYSQMKDDNNHSGIKKYNNNNDNNHVLVKNSLPPSKWDCCPIS